MRAASFSSTVIPWDDHEKWFNEKLTDSDCLLLIAMDERGTEIGQVRFDGVAGEATMSISIDRNFRGMGFGAGLIKASAHYFFSHSSVKSVRAYIKPQNESSLRAFAKAGFQWVGNTKVCEEEAIMMVQTRQQAGEVRK